MHSDERIRSAWEIVPLLYPSFARSVTPSYRYPRCRFLCLGGILFLQTQRVSLSPFRPCGLVLDGEDVLATAGLLGGEEHVCFCFSMCRSCSSCNATTG